MRLLYTIGIVCYTLGIRAAALFGHAKARLMVQGWKAAHGGWSTGDGGCAWFHAASLGEFEQARPVLEAYRRRHPDSKVLVTFFSPSGYEVRKDYAGADAVLYLPPDLPRRVHRFLDTYRPTTAFFVKYEFWYNYLDQLQRRSIPTYIFSAIFRPGQYFFKPYGRWFLRQAGRCFTHLFVQNGESLDLLRRHGIGHASLAGDTRFDRVHQIALAAERDTMVEQWKAAAPESKTLIAGSSWPPDEELLERYLHDNPRGLRLVLAPHVISEEHLASIVQRFRCRVVRYSALATGGAPAEADRVLLVDNIGLLSKLYRYADVAYIGGGFGAGIHNTLEAVTFGKPVLFGPKYGKFQEAVDLIALGGGWSHHDYPTLASHLTPLLTDPAALAKASEACLTYMRQNLGSTDTILDTIEH